jgi:hypothetical protein
VGDHSRYKSSAGEAVIFSRTRPNEDDAANRWPAYGLALLYENTSIASHARPRQRRAVCFIYAGWLILFSLDGYGVAYDASGSGFKEMKTL